MTFLNENKQLRSFDDKMKVRPENSKKIHQSVMKNFDKYCKSRYDNRDSKTVLDEMVLIKNDMDKIYDVLQGWINYNVDEGIAPSTITMYFSFLKKYLIYSGIKITTDDVKINLEFPKKQEEELYPLQHKEIQDICSSAKYDKKSLYFALISSGMRIGEAMQIRKKDLDLNHDRIIVNIPARFTKLKRSRVTFLSIEAGKSIKPKLEKLTDDDLVYGTHPRVNVASNMERNYFVRCCKKQNLDMKYESTNIRKITLHSFRSYFITKISRHDENFAKKLAGQKGYMLQYDRMTLDEKLKLYLEIEPDLLIYNSFMKDKEIKRLKEANEKLQRQSTKIEELEKKSELFESESRNKYKENELRIDEQGEVIADMKKLLFDIRNKKLG